MRAVERIEEVAGPRGGRHYFLTLECGHHATRRLPIYKGRIFGKLQFVPQRVKCDICATLKGTK